MEENRGKNGNVQRSFRKRPLWYFALTGSPFDADPLETWIVSLSKTGQLIKRHLPRQMPLLRWGIERIRRSISAGSATLSRHSNFSASSGPRGPSKCPIFNRTPSTEGRERGGGSNHSECYFNPPLHIITLDKLAKPFAGRWADGAHQLMYSRECSADRSLQRKIRIMHALW